jgi:hypothetical protein
LPTLEPLHRVPPLPITGLPHVRKGAGIASSLGSTTLAMLAKGEGLQAWATPTSPLMLRRIKVSSMLIPHSPASSRAASRQASRMASGYPTAVPWAIQASSVSLTGHSPCFPFRNGVIHPLDRLGHANFLPNCLSSRFQGLRSHPRRISPPLEQWPADVARQPAQGPGNPRLSI